MRPGLGPRFLGESPTVEPCWCSLVESDEGAVGLLGAVAESSQPEVVSGVWCEVLAGIHSLLGCGEMELEGARAGAEVDTCSDSALCSPELLELSWHWQLSGW